MAVFGDYRELTKIEKSRFNSLKKAIFEVSRKFGSGYSSPVPYDTAWVARIPDINKCAPAFPESLEWLRDHQLEDGTWGSNYPLSLYSKMLNTFAAVLAFSQWNYKQDENRIKKGTKALEMIGKSLPQEETNENTFEMLISSCLDDARGFNLDMDYEIFAWCSKIGKEKLEKIVKELMSNKPNHYWSFLEAAGGIDLELAPYRSEITQYGLIAGQPSTTAFILRYARLRGEDFFEAELVLKNLCSQNQGGIPHLVPIDNFEIVHGLDFFFKVGINPKNNVKHAATQSAIDTLRGRLDVTSGIGFSSNWPIVDAGCTAIALNLEHQFSRKRPEYNLEINTQKHNLLDIFNVSDDTNRSKNRNNLQTRVSFSPKDEKLCLENISSIKQKYLMKKSFINHTQNVSLYYSLLQYVFLSSKNSSKTLTEIENFIGKNQNNDGGWGDINSSSAEETAYVCLTIFRLVQTRKEALSYIDFSKLINFMNNIDSLPHDNSFWCYKVIFRSFNLTNVVITAAKYAIFQIQRLCMFSKELNDNQLDFLNVDFWDEKSALIYRESFPLTRPEVRRQDLEISKEEVKDICKRALQIEDTDTYMPDIIDISLDMSFFHNDTTMPSFDRAVDILVRVFLFGFDDIIDFFQKGKEQTPVVDESMKVACEILKGHYQNSDSVPIFDLSNIEFVWRWCFFFRNVMETKRWKAESFAKILKERLFKGFSLRYKLECYGILPTSKRHLQISYHDVGLTEIVHCSTLLEDCTVDSTEFENDELLQKYKTCAFKAARVLSDVPSVFRDLKLSNFDNYCISLMHDYHISMAESMVRATKKGSKEILRAYALKRIILSRENKNIDKLMLIMRNVERCIDSCAHWALGTSRYQVGQTFAAERVDHEKKDLPFTWDLCFS